jgi:hypothetical protein
MSAANWPPHAPVLSVEIDGAEFFVTIPPRIRKEWRAAYQLWRQLSPHDRLESFTEGTAPAKFRKGDRVTLSTYGREHFRVRMPRVTTGVVTGFPKDDLFLVHIRLDGDKIGASWHMDFWDAPHPPAGALIRRAKLEETR